VGVFDHDESSLIATRSGSEVYSMIWYIYISVNRSIDPVRG
jgi:hypothetical protein